MVSGILDSSILIDALRAYTPAVRWLATETNLGISQSVILEVIQGSRDTNSLRKTIELLDQFSQVEVMSIDFNWAITQLKRYRLSHNIGGNDALIAATAFRLQIPLYTLNLKHFVPMLGALAQKPY